MYNVKGLAGLFSWGGGGGGGVMLIGMTLYQFETSFIAFDGVITIQRNWVQWLMCNIFQFS